MRDSQKLELAWKVGDRFLPHPEERRLRRVSKDEKRIVVSGFETAQERLLTMRRSFPAMTRIIH
jgi:hypothetical protein